MKTLLVCTSVSHGNTRRVAEAVADVLAARAFARRLGNDCATAA
ncbi:hypothetical protein [Streptomyces sp. NPDC001502]